MVAEFSSDDGDEYVVRLVPVVKGSVFPQSCASLTISGEYASLFWFFNAGEGPGRVQHEAGVRLLGEAFASKRPVEFGWIGDGINLREDSPVCSASSRGLAIKKTVRGQNAVFSYYKWP